MTLRVKTRWRLAVTAMASALLLAGLMQSSCATTKPKEYERAGIKGSVIPVDSDGEEILMEDKENIIINCIPVRDGKQMVDKAVIGNAKPNGDFVVDLRGGEFMVEVFLEGFYVESITVVLDRNRRKNLGKIKISRIETERGVPLEDDISEELIINEGDVNIQPPVQ
jgi:hypothetical protein